MPWKLASHYLNCQYIQHNVILPFNLRKNNNCSKGSCKLCGNRISLKVSKKSYPNNAKTSRPLFYTNTKYGWFTIKMSMGSSALRQPSHPAVPRGNMLVKAPSGNFIRISIATIVSPRCRNLKRCWYLGI